MISITETSVHSTTRQDWVIGVTLHASSWQEALDFTNSLRLRGFPLHEQPRNTPERRINVPRKGDSKAVQLWSEQSARVDQDGRTHRNEHGDLSTGQSELADQRRRSEVFRDESFLRVFPG
jgi:hypothetical protein